MDEPTRGGPSRRTAVALAIALAAFLGLLVGGALGALARESTLPPPAPGSYPATIEAGGEA